MAETEVALSKELIVWPASEKVWRAGESRRRILRIAGVLLLLLGAAAYYLWSVTPFGGPESAQRYFFLLLQAVGAVLFAVGFVLLLFTYTTNYPYRITVSQDGFRVRQRSPRTGRDLPHEPLFRWGNVASSVKFLDYSESEKAALADVPFVVERGSLTWGGLDRDTFRSITRAAAEAGLTDRQVRRGTLVVHSFVPTRGDISGGKVERLRTRQKWCWVGMVVGFGYEVAINPFVPFGPLLVRTVPGWNIYLGDVPTFGFMVLSLASLAVLLRTTQKIKYERMGLSGDTKDSNPR